MTSEPPEVTLRAGLNWSIVAGRLGIDEAMLRHEGQIVLPGEYFPDEGFFLDGTSLEARHVDVGDIALQPGYFLGDLSMSGFGLRLPHKRDTPSIGWPIVPRTGGPIVGRFGDERSARRAKGRLLQAALVAGISMSETANGHDLRVERPELPGRVATVMAAHGGTVVSWGGRLSEPRSALATASSEVGGTGDALRAGTGAFGESEGPEPDTTATEIEER